jgi:MFS family permease
MALISPGLALLVFALAEVSRHGGLSATSAWLPLVAGVGLTAAFVVHALRAPRPLIDVRLFRDRAFSAASATTFLVGAALFGALFVMPLYYQLGRGQTPLAAGLLLAPQGLGVALAMPLTGPLTDRIGGGRIAFVGLLLLSAATVPFALVKSDTPLALLEVVLFVRGAGIGATMMPAMAAAYATLDTAAVPRATSALNVLQRVGGAIGTALLAVVLQHRVAAELPGVKGGLTQTGGAAGKARLAHAADPLASAFGQTFWWAFGMTLVAVVPTLVLVRNTRRAPAGAAPAPTAVAG